MVMEPVPSYEDLIWLFEAEPVYRYADDEREAGYEFDWRKLLPYTVVTFQPREPTTTSRCTSRRDPRSFGYGCGPFLTVMSCSTWICVAFEASESTASTIASCCGSTVRTTRWLPPYGYG
jgi:hypothetical protein